ncbi:unnamed protein product [Rhizophagus irregularis]|nr:unnamed protein product [Rhizophagus irregularis]
MVFLTFKRTLSITKKISLIISSQILKITSPYLKFNKKPQIKNPYYFQVKNWTSEEVNQFLKERMGDNWTTELKEFSDLYAKEIGITYNLRKIISQLYTKTIYIQDYFSNDYFQTDIHDDLEFFEFLKKAKGKGFVSINDNNKIPEHIISLKDLQHNQYYYIIKDYYSQKELDKYIYPHHTLIHSNKKLRNLNTGHQKRFLPIMTSIKFQEIIRQLQAKTIYIQDYNYEGEIKDKFYKLKIYNNEHFKDYLYLLCKRYILKPINYKKNWLNLDLLENFVIIDIIELF